MQNNLKSAGSWSPEELVERVHNGETRFREDLIQYYWDFITASVSKMIGKSAENTEEFSVALLAFN
jgi:DNA-directed RNA polymerase specialized sigma subunit